MPNKRGFSQHVSARWLTASPIAERTHSTKRRPPGRVTHGENDREKPLRFYPSRQVCQGKYNCDAIDTAAARWWSAALEDPARRSEEVRQLDVRLDSRF